MKIESVPLVIKNIESEISLLRKQEATQYFIDNMNFQNSPSDDIEESNVIPKNNDIVNNIPIIENIPTTSIETISQNIPQNWKVSGNVPDTKFEDAVQALMDKDTNIYSSSFISSLSSSSSSSSSSSPSSSSTSTSPFISANLIADIESSLFSSYTAQALSRISGSGSSSTVNIENNRRKMEEINIINSGGDFMKSKILSDKLTETVNKTETNIEKNTDKLSNTVPIAGAGAGTGTGAVIQSEIFVPVLSKEMKGLTLQRNELSTDWKNVRNKLTEINKGRIYIEKLKVSLKSAIKLGNHSRVDTIERIEIPKEENDMINIFKSISSLSPFYYLCDSVTTNEIANIIAKNTGIPMGNLLEGKKKKLFKCCNC